MNVIRNLVDNAIKYSGKPAKIKVSTRNENNLLIVSILDKGIGIPKDALPKIFNKFYRVPTGNLHNVRGFGLGLNYVKEIINLHKWKIVVDSEIGVGSVFEIKIPLPD
jgi:two-component system phosphate regulon sensor histidine kinase PhoR